jgi:hypothetical protein
MANESHYSILKSGVEAWNKWRAANPDLKHPDLSWADLTRQNLMWANLEGCDLSWAKMNRANLVLANLKNADLTGASLKKCNFSNADIEGANFLRADLTGSHFYRTNGIGAGFVEAKLDNVVVSESDFSRADFTKATLNGAVFTNVTMRDVRFEDTELVGAKFEGSDELRVDPGIVKTAKRVTLQRWLIAGSLILVAILVSMFWSKVNNTLIVTVPKSANPVLIFDGKILQPDSTADSLLQYQIRNVLPGEYQLLAYATQLDDVKSDEFVRFKRQTLKLDIGANTPFYKTDIVFDTLYSVRKVTKGILPNISADGQWIVYLQKPKVLHNTKRPKLFLHNLATGESNEVLLQDSEFYRSEWDWDRPFLVDAGKTIFLSAFNINKRYSKIAKIDVASGRVSILPFLIEQTWLKYFPISNGEQLVIENKIYTIEGKYLRSVEIGGEIPQRLYYSGKNGFLVLKTKPETEGLSKMAELLYVDRNSSDAAGLFDMNVASEPFICGTDDAKRIVLTEYLGLTKEFSSVISLWEDGVIVPLTGDIRDGERRYEDGAYFHKTEACVDNSGRRIVYEYNGNIYLIEINSTTTIEDLALANLSAAAQARLNALTP